MTVKSSKSLQADIVIIGGGGSGLVAASAALEKGAGSIIILEKRGELGGNAVNPVGLLAIGSRLQHRLGMDTTSDAAFRVAMEFGHWKINGPLVRALIDKSGDTIDWLEKKGLSFDKIITHFPNQSPNTYHVASGKESTGLQIIKTLSEEFKRSSSVRIMTSTPAEKILLDKSGKVAGVRAKDKDGKEIRIETKSVIVCTGGFSGNEKLIKKYNPSYNKIEVPPRGIPTEGDGIRMTTEIGAELDGMVVFEWEEFFEGSTFLTVVCRRQNMLWVNKKGKRFTDEGMLLMMEVANVIDRQPGKIKYCLFDSTIKQKLLGAELTPFERFFINGQDPENAFTPFGVKVEKDLRDPALKANIKKSSSWDEIAKWMGAKPEVLKATVEQYNSFCDQGHDDIFAKDRLFLEPLRQPPYYALKAGLMLTQTHGGIKINELAEVMNKEDDPIPGLYAAGVETGAKDWDTYNTRLSGHAFGFTVNTGRIAGEEAAKYVSKKF
jgi:fumarate reductase flavoprotein subunit